MWSYVTDKYWLMCPIFGLSISECMCALCKFVSTCLRIQWKESHQTLVDNLVEAKESQNFLTPYLEHLEILDIIYSTLRSDELVWVGPKLRWHQGHIFDWVTETCWGIYVNAWAYICNVLSVIQLTLFLYWLNCLPLSILSIISYSLSYCDKLFPM